MRTLTKTMVRLAATTVATGAILGAFAPDALAEGSFSSSVKQVQPQFDSRTWKDRNQDTARTKITLSNCKVNAGGKTPGSTPLQSVEVALAKGSTVVKVIKKACGTYDFGPQTSGDYKFRIMSINGERTKSRQSFLNASVSVSY